MGEDSFIELKLKFQVDREKERRLLERICGVSLPCYRIDDPACKYIKRINEH